MLERIENLDLKRFDDCFFEKWYAVLYGLASIVYGGWLLSQSIIGYYSFKASAYVLFLVLFVFRKKDWKIIWYIPTLFLLVFAYKLSKNVNSMVTLNNIGNAMALLIISLYIKDNNDIKKNTFIYQILLYLVISINIIANLSQMLVYDMNIKKIIIKLVIYIFLAYYVVLKKTISKTKKVIIAIFLLIHVFLNLPYISSFSELYTMLPIALSSIFEVFGSVFSIMIMLNIHNKILDNKVNDENCIFKINDISLFVKLYVALYAISSIGKVLSLQRSIKYGYFEILYLVTDIFMWLAYFSFLTFVVIKKKVIYNKLWFLPAGFLLVSALTCFPISIFPFRIGNATIIWIMNSLILFLISLFVKDSYIISKDTKIYKMILYAIIVFNIICLIRTIFPFQLEVSIYLLLKSSPLILLSCYCILNKKIAKSIKPMIYMLILAFIIWSYKTYGKIDIDIIFNHIEYIGLISATAVMMSIHNQLLAEKESKSI